MKVYVSIISDRHVDPEIQVFTTAESAIGHTRVGFVHTVAYPERIVELDPNEQFLFHLWYPEGDWAAVAEQELQEV